MARVIKTKAIVLLQRKYSESSIIVSAYTLHHGRQSFFIPGARKHKARIKASLFSPLSLLEIDQYRNEKGGLQKVKEVSLKYPLANLRMDLIKSSIAVFIAEFLGAILKEEEHNESLFEYIEHSVNYLDQQEKGVANFHVLFLIELTRFLGFYPHTNYSAQNSLFDLQNGIFIDKQSAHTLPAHTSKLFAELLKFNFRSIEDLHLNHNQRANSLQALIDYYNWHIPNMKEIQSLEVLTTIFS